MLSSDGAFFYYSKDTKYRGLFYPEKQGEIWTLFKSANGIRLPFEDEEITVYNDHTTVSCKDESADFYFDGKTLTVFCRLKGNVELSVDIREIYDFSDHGRIYDIYEEKGCIVIEYTKDNAYKRYMAIRTDMAHTKLQKWSQEFYKTDQERKANPDSLYVYDALSFKCNRDSKLSISYSKDKSEAILNTKDEIENEGSHELDAAGMAANSIKELYCSLNGHYGFYAGLPWFFQFWTRDEAISLGALIIEKQYSIVKNIILQRISSLNDKGRIPNRIPNSTLGTADGTDWMFYRLHQLMIALEEEKKLPEYFTEKDLSYIKSQVEKSIKSRASDLIRNSANETWMDTSYGGDSREGYRIEIQALWLSTLKFSNYLDERAGKGRHHKRDEEVTKRKVRSAFFRDGRLYDGKDDPTQRPNIFLAYYVYPELLEKTEWESTFDTAIRKLWLEWGGLSTIDKDSTLFCNEYTGEDNRSYHRGDSWYFINNIAAICMAKLNKNKYKPYINKIMEASRRDIELLGVIGRPSELSSAKEQRAESSPYQLWSAATYLEMTRWE